MVNILDMSMTSRIPSEQECLELMAEVSLAPALVKHCIDVKNHAMVFADRLEQQGHSINRPLLAAAALLHDIKKLDAEVCHGVEGGDFLRDKGFHEVARVVEKHCLNNVDDPDLVPTTTEEKLLMYADLRTNRGRMVSLDERFDYIRERYRPKNPAKFHGYTEFARKMEKEIFSKRE